MKRNSGLNQLEIILVVLAIFAASTGVVYWAQAMVEQNAFIPNQPTGTTNPKDQFEMAKIAAEIRQIRSDTSGSLFWLKMIALFVTVGGAVGGYLVGQNAATRARIDFEHRKDVDSAYQAILQELSNDSPLLRAAAVVKLGMLLRSFPYEWDVEEERRQQLIDLTKRVMAASLAIERDPTLLKVLTTAIVLHQPAKDDPKDETKMRYGDLSNIDLSAAMARDAYWAKVDFTGADLWRATLDRASFRESILHYAQFRQAVLTHVVFTKASCANANFNLADLRHANFTGADLKHANFEGAKVFGATVADIKVSDISDAMVDRSEKGDGSHLVPVREWLGLRS